MTTTIAISPALFTVRDSVDVLLLVPLPGNRGDVEVYSDVGPRAMDHARAHLVKQYGPGIELHEPTVRGEISISDRPKFGGPATSVGDHQAGPGDSLPSCGDATRE